MQLTLSDFIILNYEYLNTGGNTMVGVHTIYLPNEKRTIYALSNEDGCTLSVVDYISYALDIDDYDSLYIDTCEYGRLTSYEKYFELYRRCLNDYTKSDCRYFGITRNFPAFLLSDELQEKIDSDYLHWLNLHDYGVETDGEDIITHPDYDVELEAIKHFKKEHTKLLDYPDILQSMYDKDYVIMLDGMVVSVPFNADTFTAIDRLLNSVVEDW